LRQTEIRQRISVARRSLKAPASRALPARLP
jgi:hypothetical protein